MTKTKTKHSFAAALDWTVLLTHLRALVRFPIQRNRFTQAGVDVGAIPPPPPPPSARSSISTASLAWPPYSNIPTDGERVERSYVLGQGRY
ncbi:hypothetical protein ARMSODRAFT_1027367 [Armillaria solidipes]|uniref:Uncharacterized protein n=1 Tax=Armillaria solidipes TaxID=1076256 RepID=A0A2H3B4I1_9AGAR|nr:hypothetical protein ARMSODRAFT_1027367 [Armillaria solidipes]